MAVESVVGLAVEFDFLAIVRIDVNLDIDGVPIERVQDKGAHR
ncbi:MAG: hypothetical protein ACI9PP_000508, partial [Halobacteriales archaeon]